MATIEEFINHVCEQISDNRSVMCKKMFGECMVYIEGKPVLMIADNTVYVKKMNEIEALMIDADQGYPYKEAEEHYILDIDNTELCKLVIETILPAVMVSYNEG